MLDDKPLIFLIGYRGSGKTTVARLLAERLGWEWRDADAVLEERFCRTIRQVFADEGEPGFRDKEALVLAELCRCQHLVIATGGGVILRADNRELLRAGLVIWLTAEPEILFERTQNDASTGERRPPLSQGGLAEVREILAKREPLYRQCADMILATDAVGTDALVRSILSRFTSE